MARAHKPRSGSLQFWPRKRAKRIYPRVRAWANLDRASLLGFLGYKVGMTHVQVNENNPALKAIRLVTYSVTIIECPPLKVLGIKFYQSTEYGLRNITTIYSENLNKELKRKLTLAKKIESKFPESFDDLRLIVYTQPRLTTINKKKPEIIELALSGKKEEKLEFAKGLLNKEIKVNDVFKQSQNLDIHAVTKGKGFQGPLKRFGLQLKAHKSEKKRRAPGNLGSWTPKKILFSVPQAGQLGFQTRTEFNKTLLKIGNKPEEVNSSSGFNRYGLVKNDYLLIKGSIPGANKRLIIMTYPIRSKKTFQIEVKYIRK